MPAAVGGVGLGDDGGRGLGAHGGRATGGGDERPPPDRALEHLAVPRRPLRLGAARHRPVREGEGESLAPVAGTCSAKSRTWDHEGEMASSEKTRFVRPLTSATPVTRRAGSSHAAEVPAPLALREATSSARPVRDPRGRPVAQVDGGDRGRSRRRRRPRGPQVEAGKAIASAPSPHPRS